MLIAFVIRTLGFKIFKQAWRDILTNRFELVMVPRPLQDAIVFTCTIHKRHAVKTGWVIVGYIALSGTTKTTTHRLWLFKVVYIRLLKRRTVHAAVGRLLLRLVYAALLRCQKSTHQLEDHKRNQTHDQDIHKLDTFKCTAKEGSKQTTCQ
ncbi:Uncharacterised protein [Vibrio cholerae]|uniref:Uncharacterized protein n=1 Tax=Vibrio cholerae TaxID=666 RepID=A0A655YPH2_VIBCL|nr:Uncharacterised protein [Vibrio cholerae]CSC47936.1 Uncharacterised protein [Vibrio cholerae]CSC59645.1 Uncharacterised protein [Vibrio cholerae]CSC74365.1 Uncharacterised protein [Vibrio cholerae]CSC78775.1 Uncharacterised protein [Vibrio cholerae]